MDRCIASTSLREISKATGIKWDTLHNASRKRPFINKEFALYESEFIKRNYPKEINFKKKVKE
jgi:hypothetical protein